MRKLGRQPDLPVALEDDPADLPSLFVVEAESFPDLGPFEGGGSFGLQLKFPESGGLTSIQNLAEQIVVRLVDQGCYLLRLLIIGSDQVIDILRRPGLGDFILVVLLERLARPLVLLQKLFELSLLLLAQFEFLDHGGALNHHHRQGVFARVEARPVARELE